MVEDPVMKCKPWQAAMQRVVVVRENDFGWRQADDGHSTCAQVRRECPAEFLGEVHYVLWQCTEESSARSHDLHIARSRTKELC